MIESLFRAFGTDPMRFHSLFNSLGKRVSELTVAEVFGLLSVYYENQAFVAGAVVDLSKKLVERGDPEESFAEFDRQLERIAVPEAVKNLLLSGKYAALSKIAPRRSVDSLSTIDSDSGYFIVFVSEAVRKSMMVERDWAFQSAGAWAFFAGISRHF